MPWLDLEQEIDEEFSSFDDEIEFHDVARRSVRSQISYDTWAARELDRLPIKLREKLKARPKKVEKKKRKPRIPPAPTKYQVNYRKRKMRERLPEDREGLSHHFMIYANVNGKIEQIDGYIQTGVYPGTNRLGELFVKVGKAGDTYAWVDQFAIALSVALQFGAPVDELFRKFVGARFEPSGRTINPEIPSCTSIADYVAKWVLAKYGEQVGDEENNVQREDR